MLIDLVSCKNWSKAASKMPSSLLKKVFEVSLWERLIQDPSARRTKDSQPSGFGFEYCASHVRFRVFSKLLGADTDSKIAFVIVSASSSRRLFAAGSARVLTPARGCHPDCEASKTTLDIRLAPFGALQSRGCGTMRI